MIGLCRPGVLPGFAEGTRDFSHDGFGVESKRARLKEVALLFTRLGFTAFGCPAAHLAMMEDEVVHRRNWLDRQHFLDLVAAINLIPGPTSTEVAINLGLIRAGFIGMFVSGVCFITPAMLIILPIAWAYVRYQTLPQVQGTMRGVSAAVIAVIFAACWRFGRTALVGVYATLVFLGALAAEVALKHFKVPDAELIVLGAAAVVGVIRSGWRLPAAVTPLIAPVIMGMNTAGERGWGGIVRLTLYFLQVGATLVGSGYVLVAYLQSGLVEQRHWLSNREVTDAISVGQVTPGPLLTTATFIGYLRGHALLGTVSGGIVGGVAATLAIFLPSFVFISIVGTVLPKIRRSPVVRAALDAMNCAVVALILVVSVQLARSVLTFPERRVDWIAAVVAVASLSALLAFRLNATWLILAGAIVGWLSYARV